MFAPQPRARTALKSWLACWNPTPDRGKIFC